VTAYFQPSKAKAQDSLTHGALKECQDIIDSLFQLAVHTPNQALFDQFIFKSADFVRDEEQGIQHVREVCFQTWGQP
jgi:hypothetical protein